MPDFSALLSKPAGTIERPKPLPAGVYYGTVGAHKFDESRNKKTPFVRFTINITEPGEEVASNYQEQLADVDWSKKSRPVDFYLTDDAMFRLTEFMASIGVDDGNGSRSVGEMIPDCANRPVQLELNQQANEQRPDEVYNNIVSITGRQV